MASSSPHRIDPPSTSVRPMALRPRGRGGAPAVRVGSGPPNGHRKASVSEPENPSIVAVHGSDSPSLELLSRDELLQLHAGELIDRLQGWATDLDARESQLNARLSLQDHRERRFRLNQQDAATEIAEQQRAVQRRSGEIEAQARRLAFRDPAES